MPSSAHLHQDSDRLPAETPAQRQTRYQELLFELAMSSINLPVDGIEDAIHDALARMADLTGADRAYIFGYDFQENVVSTRHQWCAPGIGPHIDDFHLARLSDIPAWLMPHVRGETVRISDWSVLPPGRLRHIFEAQHIRKLIALPLMGRAGCVGCVGFGTVRRDRRYDPEEVRMLTLFAGFLASLVERKRTEGDLRESETRFRALFEQISNVAVQGYNRRRQVIFWNKASESLYGYRPDEALGRQLEDLIIPAPMRDGVVAGVDAWVNGGPAIPPEELTLRSKDGSPVPVYSSHVVLHTASGEPEMYCVDVDLAEQKRAAAELEIYRLHLERLVEERTRELAVAKEAAESASLAKSKFLAASSHDLRQPLMAINLFLDALSRTPMSEEQKRFTGHLKHSVHSLGEMLNTLLDIARLDSGAIEANMAAVRSSELCRWIEAEFATMFNARKLRFKLFFPLSEVVLLTDIDLLKTILRNLLDNALKFCERGGVLVGVRRRGGQALIQIWDSGKGIAPEHLRNIFEEFYQVGNQERDPSKGVGLGLSIVMRQARLIGAEIRCRSRVGMGSVFEIVLPIAVSGTGRKPETAASAGEEDLDLARLIGRRIVVIEDNLQVADAMSQSLCALGMQVSVFANADAALADPTITRADLYVSDFRLPGSMNGVQLLEAIEKRSPTPIRAVLLTGETASEQIENVASRRWKVLIKPVCLSELLATFIETQGD